MNIRKDFGIKEGDKVAFVKLKDSISLTIAHRVKLSDLYGCLPKPDKPLSIEEINLIIAGKK